MELYYILSVLSALLTAIGQISLKKYSHLPKNNSFEKIFNKLLLLSISSFVGSFLLAIFIMRVLDFSIYYSLTALNFAFIAILSAKFLDESLDLKKIVGTFIIIIGIIVFNL